MNGLAFATLQTIATATAPQALARLAIVVPCYNEAESIRRLADGLTRVRAALASSYETEVILIDDGSRDGTGDLLRDRFAGDPSVRVLRHATNMGIAAAIATGIRQSRSEIIASLDADCTYDPLELVGLLERLTDGIDVVVASPYHPAGRVIGVPQWRLALSRLASRLYGLVMRNKLHTYTSCVRIYRRSSVIDLPLEYPGFVGIVELLWQLDRRGGRIAECPAVLTARTTGQSKMRIIRAVAAHLRLLTRAALSRCRISAPAHVAHEQTTYVARFSETTP
jgi:dolichol-phosphate mannosyltransferase